MNRAELSARMAIETSLSTAGADDVVTAVFSTIDDALTTGETDRIDGFGTCSTRRRPAHQGRNPRARAKAASSPHRGSLPSRLARPFAR